MALVTAEEIVFAGRFTPGEFDWEGRYDESDLLDRAAEWVAIASGQVLLTVGASAYASTDEPQATLLRAAEYKLALAEGLEQRLIILSSRPEEAPPEEYIDLLSLREQIADLRSQANALLRPYRTSTKTVTGSGFSIVSTGVDESLQDDYDTVDFGNLEDDD